MRNVVLLCTFTTRQSLEECTDYIDSFYGDSVLDIEYYAYKHQPDSVICVYNVVSPDRRINDTISINKKKQTTTFYTINALNLLIKSLNSGILNTDYRVNWSDYENTLILSDKQQTQRLISIEKI